MSFSEVDLFGIYVAPAAAILVVAALFHFIVRRAVDALGLLRLVWHPALFDFAVYVILASGLTLWLAGRGG